MPKPSQPVRYVSDLAPSSRYRFMELEMRQFIKRYPFGIMSAINIIANDVIPMDAYNVEDGEELYAVLTPIHRQKPTKAELIYYGFYNNMTYSQIKSLFRVSSKTIAELKDTEPTLRPIFPKWTSQVLSLWNDFKQYYNLWEPKPIHCRQKERKEDNQNEPIQTNN